MRVRASALAVAASLSAAAVVALAVASCDRDPPALAPPPPAPILIPPLHDAQVGEWLRVESGVDAEVYRVVAATDFDVTVETTRYHNGEPESSPIQQTWQRNGFSMPADSVIRAIEADRIEIGGRRYDCWRLSVFSHVRQLLFWVSNEVPVHGVLKVAMVTKGQIDELHAVKLAEWGPR